MHACDVLLQRCTIKDRRYFSMQDSRKLASNSSGHAVVSADSARRSASVMNYGNIVAIALPFPLLIFWFGASMLVYAMNRHHPNPKVGHYTQMAAYRLYGVTGFFTAVATFFPGSSNWTYFFISWALAALVLIPWSLLDLYRIRNDDWQDSVVTEEHH